MGGGVGGGGGGRPGGGGGGGGPGPGGNAPWGVSDPGNHGLRRVDEGAGEGVTLAGGWRRPARAPGPGTGLYLPGVALGLISAWAEQAESPESLAAIDDQLVVEMEGSAELAVADNDVGVDAERSLALVDTPAHGTATLDDAGVLHYQAAGEYIGTDQVRYAITNPDGTSSTATVAIDVHCTTCAIGAAVTLAWDPNAPSDMVTGYRPYLRQTEDSAGKGMGGDIPIDQAGFQPTYVVESTIDDWDDYEGQYIAAAVAYCEANRDDTDSPAILNRIRAWNDAYHAWGRETLGLGWYVGVKLNT